MGSCQQRPMESGELHGGDADMDKLARAAFNQTRMHKYLMAEFKRAIKTQKDTTRQLIKEMKGQNMGETFEQMAEARASKDHELGVKLQYFDGLAHNQLHDV